MANDTRYEYGHDNRVDLLKRALDQHLKDNSNPHGVSLASLGEKEYVGSFLDILIEGDPEDITNRVVKLRLKTKEGAIIEGSEIILPMSGNATTWSAIIGDDPLVNEALNDLITSIEAIRIAGIPLGESLPELKDYHYTSSSEDFTVFKDSINCEGFQPELVYLGEGTEIRTGFNTYTQGIQIEVIEDDVHYIYVYDNGSQPIETDVPSLDTWYKVVDQAYTLEKPTSFKAKPQFIRNQTLLNAICATESVETFSTLEEKFSEVDTDIEDIKDEVDDILTGYVQKTRKVAGIPLQNDTENLQGYYYDTNQTLAAKLGTIETNKVTTDTDQTITGKKTFNGITKFGNTVEIADTEGKLTIEGNQLTPIPNTSGAKTGKLGTANYYFDNAYINTIHAHEIQVDDIQGSLEGIVNTSIIRARKIYYKTNTGYGILIPQNDNWESDRTLATTEDIKINKVSVNGKEQTINNKAINIKINGGNGINVLTNNENKETEINIDTNIVATQTDLATKQDVINDLAAIRAGAGKGDTAVQPGDLATVATSGSYTDLINTPTIPDVPVKDVKLDNTSVVDENGIAQLTSPDLTPYATNTYVDTELAKKVNKVNGNYQYLDDCGPLYKDNKLQSYVGVHDGTGPQDAAGKYLAGQIYAKDIVATDASGSWKGAKLNLYTDGFYYTKNRGTGNETAADEIAVKGDLAPYALASSVPTKTSDLTNDSNYITGSIDSGTITVGEDAINYSQVSAANVLVQADSNGKISTEFIPDGVFGNTTLGGTVAITNGVAIATLTPTVKSKLNISDATIALVNQAGNDLTTTPKQFGWVSNEGVYYILTNDGMFGNVQYYTGDWILSTGSSWNQVSNTDAVRTVNNQIGDVVIDASNLPGLAAAIEAYHDPSKVDKEITTTGKGTASIKNEVAGGGAFYESADGKYKSFVGVHDGVTGVAIGAQMYVRDNTTHQASRINVYRDKAYYIHQDTTTGSETADQEIATKGDIPDVSNFVTGTDLQTALTPYAQSANLATVATSGDYDDLTNKPTIPANTSDLTNDGSDGTSTYVESDELATVATTGEYSDLAHTPDLSIYAQSANLATVATSGDYTDLNNTPTIPDAVVANPAGENPTASLIKLKVGNTVYEIAQGGSTYTAGTGIDITNDVISIDPSVVVKSIIVDNQTYIPDNTGAVDLGSISGGVVTLGYTIED